jgi:hypothetical protein
VGGHTWNKEKRNKIMHKRPKIPKNLKRNREKMRKITTQEKYERCGGWERKRQVL